MSEIDRVFPLSWAQQRYWFEDGVFVALRFSEVVNGVALRVVRSAVRELFASCDALRIRLVGDSIDRLGQVVDYGMRVPIYQREVGVAAMDLDDVLERELRRIVCQWKARSCRSPGCALILHSSDYARRLVLIFDHIVYDGRTGQVLRDRFNELLMGRATSSTRRGQVTPVSEALAQASPDVVRIGVANAQYLLLQMRRAPSTTFERYHPLAAYGRQAYCRWELASSAAWHTIGRPDLRAPRGALVALAIALAFFPLHRRRGFFVKSNAANRSAQNMSSVGCFMQEFGVFLRTDLNEPVSVLVEDAAQRWLAAVVRTRYPYFVAKDLAAGLSAERGEHVRLGTTLNISERILEAGSSCSERVSLDRLTEMVPEWNDDAHDLFFTVSAGGGVLRFEMTAHRSLAPESEIVSCLRSVTRLLQMLADPSSSSAESMLNEARKDSASLAKLEASSRLSQDCTGQNQDQEPASPWASRRLGDRAAVDFQSVLCGLHMPTDLDKTFATLGGTVDRALRASRALRARGWSIRASELLHSDYPLGLLALMAVRTHGLATF